MKPARSSRYAGDGLEKLAESSRNKRKGTSSTVSVSTDGRRMHTNTKRVALDPKAPSTSHQPAYPPSSILNTALRNIQKQPFAGLNTNVASFDIDPDPFDREFYDTNIGGFDDDYVETNLDQEDGGGRDGGEALMEGEGETVCGVDEQGVVVHLTDEDARKARNFASDNPLLSWLPHRQEYLDEFLRYEGRSHWSKDVECPCCGASDTPPSIRCEDCFGEELICDECAVSRHQCNPFHSIKRWNGRHFVRDSLANIGLIIRLGAHRLGSPCSTGQTLREFTVIHTNGIHNVTVEVCHCSSPEVHPRVQLLRAGIYPATALSPHSGATFVAMKLFHLLSLQGKLTGFDFMNGLERYSDNSGNNPPAARLPAFMNMARQWRHLKMLKRAARGHDPKGAKATAAGELAVQCPACPRPGVNLPAGWDAVSPRDRWLYRLILAMDANFRLKNRLRTSSRIDPGLGTGWAYFVPEVEYKNHILKYVTQEEISTCSGFEALANANQKNAKGLRSTGVGGMACARHTLWRPTGMGDLQKGERYCNMDFIFCSGTRGTERLHILLSYDVICQWKKYFFSQRVAGIPANIQPRFGPEAIQYAVPKFHLPPHEAKCQAPHSLNFKPGAGETDGEGIERNWSQTNGAAPSTKEMGPGARHDTLDDLCGYFNWQKVTTLDALLERRLENALVEAEDHIGIFEEFTADLARVRDDEDQEQARERQEQVAQWRQTVLEFESGDMSGPSPYDLDGEVVTLAMVTRRHADQEAEQVRVQHNVIPGRSAFLLEGISIEDTQRELAFRLKQSKTTPTDNQATSFKDQQTHLLRRIQRFRNDQDTHMPRVTALISPEDIPTANTRTTRVPEAIQLYMPSNIAENIRPTYCDDELCKMEKDIRYACAIDALGDLRRSLHLRVYINKLKIKNVTGQRQNTRQRTMQSTIEHRVSTAAGKYRQARCAFISLAGEEEGKQLRELKPGDVAGLGERAVLERERREIASARRRVLGGGDGIQQMQDLEDETNDQVGIPPNQPTSGESRRHISWLWYQGGLEMEEGALSKEMNDGVRVEWLKARARAQRWEEEVRLLREEMERTVRTFTYMASWWDERTERTQVLEARPAGELSADPELREGLVAYASEHAEMYRSLRRRFEARWKTVREAAQIVLARNSVLDEA